MSELPKEAIEAALNAFGYVEGHGFNRMSAALTAALPHLRPAPSQSDEERMREALAEVRPWVERRQDDHCTAHGGRSPERERAEWDGYINGLTRAGNLRSRFVVDDSTGRVLNDIRRQIQDEIDEAQTKVAAILRGKPNSL